jgi:hypothetical protein
MVSPTTPSFLCGKLVGKSMVSPTTPSFFVLDEIGYIKNVYNHKKT